ncbi:MAG: ABC transporter substrate-binding protein [Candidatus Promineifilaceae bacterium]
MTLKKLSFFLVLLAAFIVACSGDTAQDIQDVADQVGDAAEQVADNAEGIANQAEEVVEQAAEVVAQVVDELSCDDAIGCVEIAAGDPIKLASALVVTGPNESLGLDSQYGVEIAIADRGELFGHEVTLQAEDDGCSAEGGQTAGQKIVSDPSIVGVVGTSCSGAGVPMSQIVCDAGIAMVSPSNTAPVLTGEDTRQSCYFRTAHNDKIQGKAMADFVYNELGITKAAAIHDGDPYTEGLASVFRDSFTANGGEIVAFEAEAADATNVEPLLTSVAAAGPELIYYPVFIPLGSLLTKTAQEIDGLAGVTLAAADGVLSPDFIDAAGDASEGMYMSGPDLGFGNDIYTNFLATYEAEYGTEPTAPFHAHAYDATNMILDAIAAVAQVDADGNMLIGRQALIDAIGSTSGMAGITGTLSCDANGDCADARIAVNQVQAGEFVPVAGAADAMDSGAMGDGFSVCQVTDVGGIDDKSFNATAWVGAEIAADSLNGEAKFLESQQQTDYERNINAFVDEGCDLIVTVGFLLGDATAAAAEANPDQKFSIIDFAYEPAFDNVIGQVYAIDQAAFLAGYVAASATETGIVGTFGGINIPPVTAFMDGYVMGVNYHNETQGTSVEVIGWDLEAQDGLFTGNFDSTDDGRTLGESLLDEGADVILPVAGPVGLGTAAAVQERGNAWIVGVDTDWTQSAPEFSDIILTSIMKRMDVSVVEVSNMAASGDFEGGLFVSTLENGGVSITDGPYEADIEPLIQGIVAGEIATAPGQMMDSGDGAMASSDEECAHDMSGQEIVLHQQAGREGPLASILGDGFALATVDIVNYINDNGGICGAEVVVEFCETNYNPEMEVACYEQFRAADPKPVMLFTYGSGATIALKDRVVEDKIPNLAAGLNADAFYNPADGYTFGAAPIYSDQFAGFVEFVSENWADIKPEGASDDIVVGVIGWANAFGAGATTDAAIAYAESLGVTVLPLEEQAISPDADVSGSVQTLALGGANVIYSQNLSFGTAQVIGTIRALGLWDSFVVGGVNWTFNTDVLAILGENVAIADGYYGMMPYAWWSDSDIEGVQLAEELLAAGGHGPSARATTYLTTLDSFLIAKKVLISVINEHGPEGITGENVKLMMESMGEITGQGILHLDAADGSRASHKSQVRQWKWNGESMDYTIAQDWAPLPDTRP